MRKRISIDKELLTGKFNRASIGHGRSKIDVLFEYSKNRLSAINFEASRGVLPSNYELLELLCKLSLLEEQKVLLSGISESGNLVTSSFSFDGGPTTAILYTVPVGKELIIPFWCCTVAGIGASGTNPIGKFLAYLSGGSSLVLAYSDYLYRAGSDAMAYFGSFEKRLPSSTEIHAYSANANTRVTTAFVGVLIDK